MITFPWKKIKERGGPSDLQRKEEGNTHLHP
jgi:hypothetical protein